VKEEDYIITAEDADALLRFLPELEKLNGQYGMWGENFGLPVYVNFNETVHELIQCLYDHGWVYPFDWGAWQGEADKYWNDPELLATADTEVLRKLLTTHVRQDRFCEGHLLTALEGGHIMAILKRIDDIRKSSILKNG
jgi:hypothetical protein